MIDSLVVLLRLAAGLFSLLLAGYALVVLLLPGRSTFAALERLALSLGLGCLGLSLWMLLLGWLQVPYALLTVAAPWLLVMLPALGLAGRRGWLRADGAALRRLAATLLTLGAKAGFSRVEQLFLLLLLLALAFAAARAGLYPFWAWDELATWGLKAKAFYLARGLDLSRMDAHNYYPNLVPLILTYLYLWLGGISEAWAKLLFPLAGASALSLFYCFLRRLELVRATALAATAFLLLNGATFLTHLFIAYADLMLTWYHLAAAGLLYLWLAEAAPPGSAALITCCCGGMAWCKYEGWPLVLILVLAAVLSLLWLRPARGGAKIGAALFMGLGCWLISLPWRQFVHFQGWEVGLDHVGGFYVHQLYGGGWLVLKALVWIPYFGLLWPAIILSLVLAGRSLWQTPVLFLALLVAGNLAAVVLAFAIVPTSPAEFPLYVRATVDRLLLHVAPASALALSIPLAKNQDDS
jgi:hypothetical protein